MLQTSGEFCLFCDSLKYSNNSFWKLSRASPGYLPNFAPGVSDCSCLPFQAWLTEIHEYAKQDVVLMLLGNKVRDWICWTLDWICFVHRSCLRRGEGRGCWRGFAWEEMQPTPASKPWPAAGRAAGCWFGPSELETCRVMGAGLSEQSQNALLLLQILMLSCSA